MPSNMVQIWQIELFLGMAQFILLISAPIAVFLFRNRFKEWAIRTINEYLARLSAEIAKNPEMAEQVFRPIINAITQSFTKGNKGLDPELLAKLPPEALIAQFLPRKWAGLFMLGRQFLGSSQNKGEKSNNPFESQ